MPAETLAEFLERNRPKRPIGTAAREAIAAQVRLAATPSTPKRSKRAA